MPDERNDNQAYERAHKRVEELRDFYGHLGIYLAVNLGLFLINMLTNPRGRWFLWPLIIWGSIVLFHGVTIMLGGVFGKRWEERKTRQLMEREHSRWGPRPPQPRAP
jgi:hypothetical protein